MKYVTKEEFREIYFRLGGGRGGWTQSYWDKFFEPTPDRPMKYQIEEPASPEHNCMWIVSDYETNEYRLFFMTEENSDSALEFPEYDDATEPPRDDWTQRP